MIASFIEILSNFWEVGEEKLRTNSNNQLKKELNPFSETNENSFKDCSFEIQSMKSLNFIARENAKIKHLWKCKKKIKRNFGLKRQKTS